MNKAQLCAALNLYNENLNSAKEIEPSFYHYTINKIKEAIKNNEKIAYLRFSESSEMTKKSAEELKNMYLTIFGLFWDRTSYAIEFQNNILGTEVIITKL